MGHRYSEANDGQSWHQNPPPPYADDFAEDHSHSAPRHSAVPGAYPSSRAEHGAYDNHDSHTRSSEPRSTGRHGGSRDTRPRADNGGSLLERLQARGRDRDRPSNRRVVEDVYIAVMGVTGAGKSSFIELITGTSVKVGHGLESCTVNVEDFTFMYNDEVRVHLIDTPGFDDTNRKDTDVLKDIASWLGTTYQQGILLSGIIYLHRISDPRMSGGAYRNLGMFKKLCGEDCYQSLVLVTTFWGAQDQAQAARLEEELKTKNRFWGDMLARGGAYMRHTVRGDVDSAMRILDKVMTRRGKFKTNIQREMVDKHMDLHKTGAGRQLNADLIALQEEHKRDMRDLEESWKAAMASKDREAAAAIEEVQRQLQKDIDKGREAQEELIADLQKLNKEREEEVKRYQSDVEKRIEEMAELKRLIDKYNDGSAESKREQAEYKEQIKELQNNLASVRRRQPSVWERFDNWVEDKFDRLEAWWDSL